MKQVLFVRMQMDEENLCNTQNLHRLFRYKRTNQGTANRIDDILLLLLRILFQRLQYLLLAVATAIHARLEHCSDNLLLVELAYI